MKNDYEEHGRIDVLRGIFCDEGEEMVYYFYPREYEDENIEGDCLELGEF